MLKKLRGSKAKCITKRVRFDEALLFSTFILGGMTLKRKTYEMPELFLILFKNSDVITASGNTPGGTTPTDPEPDTGEWDTVM